MIENFVIIIGAMKSGTTTLFDILKEHPQLAPCTPKEPNFFGDDSNWEKGIDWYQSLWDWNTNIHKYALEASTHYTMFPRFRKAPERILRTERNFKFIYIIRDPIERIESHCTHLVSKNDKSGLLAKLNQIDQHILDVSMYAKQLDAYYSRFSKDDILLLDFSKLKTNALSVINEVVNFLKIDRNYKFEKIDIRSNVSNEKIQYPYWWNSLKQPARMLFPQFLRYKFRSYVTSPVKYQKLTSNQRNLVLSQLREDIDRLNKVYGFDTSSWNMNI